MFCCLFHVTQNNQGSSAGRRCVFLISNLSSGRVVIFTALTVLPLEGEYC